MSIFAYLIIDSTFTPEELIPRVFGQELPYDYCDNAVAIATELFRADIEVIEDTEDDPNWTKYHGINCNRGIYFFNIDRQYGFAELVRLTVNWIKQYSGDVMLKFADFPMIVRRNNEVTVKDDPGWWTDEALALITIPYTKQRMP